MMLFQRGQGLDYLSPCSSSNKKRLDRLLRQPVWWSGAHSGDDGGAAKGSAADDGKSSETPTVMAMIGGGWRRGSSFGSCPGLSLLGSIDEPATPSPVCSPATSPRRSQLCCCSSQLSADGPSFATPMQSSCIISNDGKQSTLPEEEMEGSPMGSCRKATNARNQPPQCTRKSPSPLDKMREDEGSCPRKPTTRSCKPLRDPARTGNGGDDGKLPAVRQIQEERGDDHDDVFYTGSSGDRDSGFDDHNSDIESVMEDHRDSGLDDHSFVDQTRGEMEAKLSAWREARTMKLMNKLKEEEDAINEWERKKITKARMEMQEFEMKLEKRRSKAMEVMQRKIRSSQKKAEKKKLKQRAAAARKISHVTKAFDKFSSTGKLSWRLVFL